MPQRRKDDTATNLGFEAKRWVAANRIFHNDRHPTLKADSILANPPLNISDWGGERLQCDNRWHHGGPRLGYAHFAWWAAA